MTEVRKKEEYDRETEDAGPDGISEDIEENEEGFSFRGFCEEALPLLLTAYLFIVFCSYPFYLKDGYTDVGKEKFNFYKVMTIGGFSLILPLVLACVSFRVKENIGKEGGAEAGGGGRDGAVRLGACFPGLQRPARRSAGPWSKN